MTHKVCALLLAASLLSIVGCGGENRETTYPVTGKLTYKGNAVAGANVILSPKSGGAPATAVTDDNGEFSVGTYESGDGAVPGEYTVTVNKYDTPAEPAAEGGSADSIYAGDDEDDEMDDYDGAEDVAEAKNELPAKYAQAGNSGLSHTVTEGPTTLTLELE